MTDELNQLKVENLQWKNLINSFVHLREDNYFTNPKYDNYPVVNITYEAANLYCEWLTKKYKKDLDKNIVVKLPTKMQWVTAAKGEHTDSVFAWGTTNHYNEKGTLLGNFKIDKNPTIDSVKSFKPNQFGLYNISGNVAEMTNRKCVGIGGNWNTPPINGTTENLFIYNYISPMLGFRPILVFE